MSELSKLIGRQVLLIRKSKDLNQDQVAEKTGVYGFNKSRVSRVETGDDNITLKTLENIMNALEITPYELFDFKKFQNPLDHSSKEMIIEAHKYMLMERGLNEVEYVVRTTQDLIETFDINKPKPNDSK